MIKSTTIKVEEGTSMERNNGGCDTSPFVDIRSGEGQLKKQADAASYNLCGLLKSDISIFS